MVRVTSNHHRQGLGLHSRQRVGIRVSSIRQGALHNRKPDFPPKLVSSFAWSEKHYNYLCWANMSCFCYCVSRQKGNVVETEHQSLVSVEKHTCRVCIVHGHIMVSIKLLRILSFQLSYNVHHAALFLLTVHHAYLHIHNRNATVIPDFARYVIFHESFQTVTEHYILVHYRSPQTVPPKARTIHPLGKYPR